jgi:hypothetical protein
MFAIASLAAVKSRELATSLPAARSGEPCAAAVPAALVNPSCRATQEREYGVTTRRFILAIGTVFALVVPMAHAATAKKELHNTPTHSVRVAKAHRASSNAASAAAATTSTPMVGTATPIEATTSDDYDNPQTTYGSPQPTVAPAATDPSSNPPQNPQLIDGYLLINQVT